ncbi:hypothetical protein PSPO01_01199 [Paraphaeosphaeria sporulosa]
MAASCSVGNVPTQGKRLRNPPCESSPIGMLLWLLSADLWELQPRQAPFSVVAAHTTTQARTATSHAAPAFIPATGQASPQKEDSTTPFYETVEPPPPASATWEPTAGWPWHRDHLCSAHRPVPSQVSPSAGRTRRGHMSRELNEGLLVARRLPQPGESCRASVSGTSVATATAPSWSLEIAGTRPWLHLRCIGRQAPALASRPAAPASSWYAAKKGRRAHGNLEKTAHQPPGMHVKWRAERDLHHLQASSRKISAGNFRSPGPSHACVCVCVCVWKPCSQDTRARHFIRAFGRLRKLPNLHASASRGFVPGPGALLPEWGARGINGSPRG